MIHHPDERDQLALLHDRHKRFSLEAYDHNDKGDAEKLKEAQKKRKQTATEIENLIKKIGI